jgi:hypothetical protein
MRKGILLLAPITPIAVQARYSNIQAQSLILATGVERSQHANVIGLSVPIRIIGEAYDDNLQALRATIPNWLTCQNLNPHIVISWVDTSAPAMSNRMLQAEPTEGNFNAIAHCLVEFFDWDEEPSPSPKNWKKNKLLRCSHVWMTGDRQGQQCEKQTRRGSGRCTDHRH